MKTCFIAAACMLLIAAGNGLAHHSAAGIDRSQTATIEGTVREFRWQNPHSFMQIDVAGDGAETVTWTLEMTAPSFLIRAGWTRFTVRPGDAGNGRRPSLDQRRSGRVVRLGDGD